ncbi:MAG: hypothetical protein AAFO79_05380 [Pseudomonadota bacterium]
MSLTRSPALVIWSAALCASAALIALAALFTPAAAQSQPEALDFIEVAKRSVTASDRRQRISIPARRGGYTGLKLRIAKGGVLIQKLTITPRDGAAQAFRVTRFMESGQETEVIALSGERRFVRQLELEYGSVDVRGRGADLVVLAQPGIALPSDRVARAPDPVVPPVTRDTDRLDRRADRRERRRDDRDRDRNDRDRDDRLADLRGDARDDDRRTFDDRDDARDNERFANRVEDDRDLLRPRNRLGYDDTSAELVVVGELRIRRTRDTEDLDLRDNRRFTAIAIQARRADARIRDVRVRLDDGETVRLQPRGVLQVGDITSVFELNAGRRGAVVREVTVVADKLDRRGPDPELVILMRQAPGRVDRFADRRRAADDFGQDEPRFDDRDRGDDIPRNRRRTARLVEAFPALPDAWESLGTVNLRSRRLRRSVDVGRRAGRFDAVLLRVTGADVRLTRFDVTFGNGRRQPIDVERVMRDGDQSAVYLLRGRNGRFVDVIELGARLDGAGQGRATVEIFGRQTLPVPAE